MRHGRKFLAPAAMLVAWLSSGAPAQSCSCVRPPATPQEVMRKVPLLFWGRAVSVQEEGNERVYAVEVWVGNAALPVTVAVRTQRHSAACGIELPLNQAELIAGAARDGYVQAGQCTKYWVDQHKAAITEMLKTCQALRALPAPAVTLRCSTHPSCVEPRRATARAAHRSRLGARSADVESQHQMRRAPHDDGRELVAREQMRHSTAAPLALIGAAHLATSAATKLCR